jgi:short-subunit dehydrogenase
MNRKTLDQEYSVALVTGASSGIGAEISKELCLTNITVIAVARDRKKLETVKKSLPKSKQKFFIVLAKDLAKKADLRDIVTRCNKENYVDLVINNAGVGIEKDFVDLTDSEISQIFSTNLFGHVYITREMLKNRKSGHPFHIVFVSSLAGKIGFPRLSAYTASKFAIEGLSEALQQEYKGTSVSITVLRPGITDTGFFKMAKMYGFGDNAIEN